MTTIDDSNAVAASRPSPELASGALSARPLVLVVDDSDAMRELLREVLESRGHEVLTAGSSGRALTLMTQRVPDLVITDLMMPGMSGFSLRSLMLRRPELAPVPVIVLSAYWARPSETLDAVAVLTKPINLDRLIEAVDQGLASKPAG
jgi:chemosensory pili system protein ChpA (sensor histidine kinase/response regulator)